MTWRDALTAVQDGNQDAILEYTRQVVRLNPAPEWTHFVGLALWEARRRLARMTDADKPDAYVRLVAKRLRHKDEQLVLGRHPVYDETGKQKIGYVMVGSLYDQQGALVEPQRAGACGLGFVPIEGVDVEQHTTTPRDRRVKEHNAQPLVLALDAEERAFQSAQRKGYSRREIPAYLGWDAQRANRVYMRLYRRRQG